MKLTKFIILFILLFSSKAFSEINVEFENWKNQFKTLALKNQISEKTFELTMSNVIFLPKVIEYDRFQPEFYEDTYTYISKRTSDSKVKKGIKLYKNETKLIDNIEKELLLSLMGIETNFGTYVGKMDILSSLSTLSFDKRRSEFFTNELLILLKLIDNNQIDYKIY